jgi:hypothetical protein
MSLFRWEHKGRSRKELSKDLSYLDDKVACLYRLLKAVYSEDSYEACFLGKVCTECGKACNTSAVTDVAANTSCCK